MRVLHLSSLYAPHAFGGAERVVQTLAEGLSKRGMEVGVAHIAPRSSPPALKNGVKVFPLRHRNPLWIEQAARYPGVVRTLNKIATLFNVLTAADFDRLLADFRPDIVHTHSMVEIPPRMWKLAKARGASVVHTLHDYDLLCIRAALFKGERRCDNPHLACAAFSSVKRRYHVHIDQVVGVSDAILRAHVQRGLFGHLKPEERHVVWNPVKPVARPAPGKPCADSPFTFGFLGRLVPEKGILTLLEACARLRAQGWRLRIAGRAPAGDAALRERFAASHIEWVGYVEPGEFLGGIDTLIVPSAWHEPFGLTTVEAYAAGVPVLGSDIGGISEIIRQVDPGALFRPADPESLAQKMRERLALGRRPLSAEGCAGVLERTQPDFVVEQYREIYRRCTGMQAAPATA